MTEIKIRLCHECGQRVVGDDSCLICARMDLLRARVDEFEARMRLINYSLFMAWVAIAAIVIVGVWVK